MSPEQAAGLPVVVADGGSLPERVAGGGGLVARSGDVEAWTRALTQSADDVRLASDLAGQARRVATASSWTTVAQAHERLYEELLRPRRARGSQGDARPG
jgi:glycosyltransferase involved in cell wall biosynthesis